MIYNPYRKFDKGMDDAYMGREPEATDNRQYMRGYEYAQMLLDEPNVQASVARDAASSNADDQNNSTQIK